MNTTIPERTPLLIAAEINTINRQTGAMLFQNALEIGRRLKEAKALVKHGEWSQWLTESVRYSQRSAARLIQLYDEYGVGPADPTATPNSSALSNITYTNALILLDVPSEQRDEFIANHDIANMSSRALKQAVTAARSDGTGQGSGTPAPGLNDSSALKLDEALQKIDDLQSVLSAMAGTITALTHHVQNLEQRVQELTAKVLTGKAGAPKKSKGIRNTKKHRPPAAVGTHTAPTTGSAQPAVPATLTEPDVQTSAAPAAHDPDSADTQAAGSTRSEPGFKVSGLDNPDPDYYTREADNLYSLHVKAITDAFTQLQQLMKVLALDDKAKKEELRQKLKKLMERLAASIAVWPPVVKMS